MFNLKKIIRYIFLYYTYSDSEIKIWGYLLDFVKSVGQYYNKQN